MIEEKGFKFKLNNPKVSKFILAHGENIESIKNERQGVEVKVFLDPNGTLYFVPINEINVLTPLLDSEVEFII